MDKTDHPHMADGHSGSKETDAATASGEVLARSIVTSRRRVMCGALGVGAVGVLAACGTEEAEDSDNGGDTNGDTNGDDNGGTEEALAQVADVPVGGGIVVGSIVLVQPEEDQFEGYDATCPHEGTMVNAPDDDGVITCPNHGSQFALDGDLLEGPATEDLSQVEIEVRDDEIWAV